MQMASGGISILDSLLEIVDTKTVSEPQYHLEFNNVNGRGSFIVVSDPPGNIENMQKEQNVQTFGLLNMTHIQVTGDPKSVRNGQTSTIRASLASTGYIDYWTATGTLTGDVLDVTPLSGTRMIFIPGYTYYLLKVKGM